MTSRDDALGNGGNLGGSFAYAEDYFGEPLAEFPMVIDACEAQILERGGAHRGDDLLGRGVGIERAGAHAIEQVSNLGNGHKSLEMAGFR
jgi:hypothetical protein